LSTELRDLGRSLDPSSAPTAPARLVASVHAPMRRAVPPPSALEAAVPPVVVRIELLDLHPFRSPRQGCPPPGAAGSNAFCTAATPWRFRDPTGFAAHRPPRRAAAVAASGTGCRSRRWPRRPRRRRRRTHARQQVGHVETPVKCACVGVRGRAGPVNLLPVDFAGSASLRGVVRESWAWRLALAGLGSSWYDRCGAQSNGGSLRWCFALWARGLFDSLFGGARAAGNSWGKRADGGVMPGAPRSPSRMRGDARAPVDADPRRHPPGVLAGIPPRRDLTATHEHDAPKRGRHCRLISRYPKNRRARAQYVRPLELSLVIPVYNGATSLASLRGDRPGGRWGGRRTLTIDREPLTIGSTDDARGGGETLRGGRAADSRSGFGASGQDAERHRQSVATANDLVGFTPSRRQRRPISSTGPEIVALIVHRRTARAQRRGHTFESGRVGYRLISPGNDGLRFGRRVRRAEISARRMPAEHDPPGWGGGCRRER